MRQVASSGHASRAARPFTLVPRSAAGLVMALRVASDTFRPARDWSLRPNFASVAATRRSCLRAGPVFPLPQVVADPRARARAEATSAANDGASRPRSGAASIVRASASSWQAIAAYGVPEQPPGSVVLVVVEAAAVVEVPAGSASVVELPAGLVVVVELAAGFVVVAPRTVLLVVDVLVVDVVDVVVVGQLPATWTGR